MVVGLGNFATSPLLFHELHDGSEEVAQRQPGEFVEIIDQLYEPKIVVAALAEKLTDVVMVVYLEETVKARLLEKMRLSVTTTSSKP